MTKITAKGDRYYQVRRNLLESVTGVTKCDKRLLQSMTIITKLDVTALIYWKEIHLKLLLLRRLR